LEPPKDVPRATKKGGFIVYDLSRKGTRKKYSDWECGMFLGHYKDYKQENFGNREIYQVLS